MRLPEQRGQPLVGPHNEGSKVVLECETQGGYPEPALTWWRDGRLVDDSYELVSAADGSLIGQRNLGARRELGADEFGAALAAHLSSLEERQASDGGAAETEEEASSLSSVSAAELSLQASPLQPLATPTADSEPPSGQNEAKRASNQNRLIRNTLELVSLTRADLLANYSCQAWNTRLGEPPASSIMIDMHRKYLLALPPTWPRV